ncbi:MAG: hypothetical protein EGQ00_05840 [Parabacteroides johnsonii]|nr:hypothetical protein [Parabacteroides johnsonii]
MNITALYVNLMGLFVISSLFCLDMCNEVESIHIKNDNNPFFVLFLFHLKFRFIQILHFVRQGAFCLTRKEMRWAACPVIGPVLSV